jgi:hypothetical protein
MTRPFEETRQMAADNISDMERRLARMTRIYNRYMKHGATNAAAEWMTGMEALTREIESEEHLYRLTFY